MNNKIKKISRTKLDIKPNTKENFLEAIELFDSTFSTRNVARLNLYEGALLYKYATKIQNGNILEIGRMHGGSTILLSLATHKSEAKVVSIDIEDNMTQTVKDFFDTYEEKERVDIRIDNSWKMKPIECNLLFIDGDHSYKGVKKDFHAHWNSLKIGGYCLAHDYQCRNCSGVTKLIDDFITQGYAEKVDQKQTMIVLKKVKNL